ncbi:ankyrin [Hyaloscypha bicolor E]|uniref:Ankyrin n=1 Tax=Hyaloscypha bicolor E TaxID=1095630 RepID=A0A2J6T634_9HELO|nr:ankyrin [Hyaloscypha bicolor E]PMD58413.1 ankyrin [Hyaloscypha bicolor E]
MPPNCGNTPLHQSVLSGHVSVMNVLLAHGAHPDAVDDSGRTALHLACEKGQEQIVRLLNLFQPL